MNKFNIFALIAIISLSIMLAQSDKEIYVSEKIKQLQEQCNVEMYFYKIACISSDDRDSCLDELQNSQDCYEKCLNDNENFSDCYEQCKVTNKNVDSIFEYLMECLNK